MGRPATCGCGSCGTCRQREYMREYRKTHVRTPGDPERRRRYELARYHTNPDFRLKHNARFAIAQRVRRGMVEKGPCALCEDSKTVAHHNDYGRPFDVVWLCHPCHNTIHGYLPEVIS